MNPVIPLSLLIFCAVLVFGIGAWASWRSSSRLTTGSRCLLLIFRLVALLAAFIPLVNPGKWIDPFANAKKTWLVIEDTSPSMRQAGTAEETRSQIASRSKIDIEKYAKQHDIPVRSLAFANDLMVNPSTSADSDSVGTRPLAALDQAFSYARGEALPLAGIILLSDGRSTESAPKQAIEQIALRALSQQIPIHAMQAFDDMPMPDLELIAPSSSLTAFPSQPISIQCHLRNTALPPQQVTIVLTDQEGKEISRTTAQVASDRSVSVTLQATAPLASQRWSVSLPVRDGEVRTANNSAPVNLRVVNSKTRVFIAEGAPYWDSKFLAQLLRQQKYMDVKSIHKLSDERYFRVDSSDEKSSKDDSTETLFPSSPEEFAPYDLIVFGKNIDSFLDETRLNSLQQYVRDHGGAILFSRGKASTSHIPALEALEPVNWATGLTDDFYFTPTKEGESAGLFGQALPAPSAALWNQLPPLKDAHTIQSLKPFTRVLAEGRSLRGTSSTRHPVLMMRRYGQGVCGLVNADGLWKWDFFPEARELGNSYEEFWTQLIQWMASYSEFLPGYDYSLRLPTNQGVANEAVPITISYRGDAQKPQPSVLVTNPQGLTTNITPAALADPSGRPVWRTSFTPDANGLWKISISDATSKTPAPETTYFIPPLPMENDDLTPDLDFLNQLTITTNGSVIGHRDLGSFLSANLIAAPPARPELGAVWSPSWTTPFLAIVIATLLSIEWLIRRRQGLS